VLPNISSASVESCQWGVAVSVAASTDEVYYDPFSFEIDDDPYPVWKRMRDEAPLYYNERLDFYALTRWTDVHAGLMDWRTLRSGDGTTFPLITSGITLPPGIILMEDPPLHDLHRALLSAVFTPKRMNAIEPLVRDFCRSALDPLIGSGEFDVIEHFAALVPMRTIGFLLGIPEQDQETIRSYTDDALLLEEGTTEKVKVTEESFTKKNDLIGDYIDWRAKHPSADLMTELLNAEITEDGVTRRLTRTEVLTYTNTVVGAGNETATRLIGFMAQLLADHPDQQRAVVGNRALLPQAVEETLRFEAPSPIQCRRVTRDVEFYGQTVPAGSVLALINGSANRDERHFPDGETFDVHRRDTTHLSFGRGTHFCLGASLARLEARVAMDEFMARWPEWQVDHSAASKAHTASVRGWATLPVRVPC
jgi:cytochrome P450